MASGIKARRRQRSTSAEGDRAVRVRVCDGLLDIFPASREVIQPCCGPVATGQWESAGSAVDHDRIDTCLLRSRRAVADRGKEKPAQDRRRYEQFQLPSQRLCPMSPEAPLLRVQQTPGVQRCSGLSNEFHGGHYRPGPSAAASPDWGIGAHFFEFSCSVGCAPSAPGVQGAARSNLFAAYPPPKREHMHLTGDMLRDHGNSRAFVETNVHPCSSVSTRRRRCQGGSIRVRWPPFAVPRPMTIRLKCP